MSSQLPFLEGLRLMILCKWMDALASSWEVLLVLDLGAQEWDQAGLDIENSLKSARRRKQTENSVIMTGLSFKYDHLELLCLGRSVGQT